MVHFCVFGGSMCKENSISFLTFIIAAHFMKRNIFLCSRWTTNLWKMHFIKHITVLSNKEKGMIMYCRTYTEHLACTGCESPSAGPGAAPRRSAPSPGRSSAAATCSALVRWWCRWARPDFASHSFRKAPSPRRPRRRAGRAPLCRWPPVTRSHRPAGRRGRLTRRPSAPLW